jgi:hypothetical protein
MYTIEEPAKSAVETSLLSEQPAQHVKPAEFRFKGRSFSVPSVEIDGKTFTVTGTWLKTAAVLDEDLVEGDTLVDLDSFVSRLRRSGARADLLTFAQRLPEITPKHGYRTEWENVAVVPITSFSHWWNERAEYSVRKSVNRAKKTGLVAKVVEFDDQLLEGISRIYNEVPVRQGKNFWHYGKDLESIKRPLATYLDRSIFIGAYYQDELIGFMKITWVGSTAAITQILSMKQHFDKRPNNLMIAKAIEICEKEGKSHFIYGQFVYFDANSTLTEFKRRNGFEPVLLPRYYVPLTLKGRIALLLRLHRGVARNTPKGIMRQFLRVRKLWAERKQMLAVKNPTNS